MPALWPKALRTALLALLLSLRLMTPQGFMPTWDAGQFRISPCDDAGLQIGRTDHHGSHGKDAPKHRQPCPFAAISGQSFITSAPAAIFEPLEPAASVLTPLRPVALSFVGRVLRPPTRAPPAQD